MERLTIGIPPVLDTTELTEIDVAKSNLLRVDIEPREPKMVSPGQKGAFRIFSLGPIENPSKAPSMMRIYFSPSQIQETFTNDLTDHFLSQILKTSERLGQVFQSLGWNQEKFEKAAGKLWEKIPFHKMINNWAQESTVAQIGKNMVGAIASVLQGHRFDFPKMWSDSRAEMTYEIVTRLYCHNPSSDRNFEKSIIKPLKNLLMYVLPREAGADHYQWPYFCRATAPGLFDLPEAIISSISINKGLALNLGFGNNNRPNIIELSIQITSIRNVLVNDNEGKSVLPYKLSTYLDNLRKADKEYSIHSLPYSTVAKRTKSKSNKIPPELVSDVQKDTYNSLQNVYPSITS